MSNTTEWVEWDAAMRLLARGGVSMPWRSLQNWACHGLVESKPGTMISDNGAILADEVLPKEVWRGRPNPTNGALRFFVPDPLDDAGPDKVLHILAPQFRKDQLVALVPHLSPEQATEALRPVGSAIPAEAPPSKGKGGAKKDQSSWDAFWMAVVDIAMQERLTSVYFKRQEDLSAEILEAIGDALAPRTIKPVVSQIWRKWIDPPR